MAVPYNHRAVEEKWRKHWEEHPVNVNDGKKPKYYCLDMFPYPSGNGLHVGHWRGYVISDVWSRYKLMQGHYIIHPMGWDAFGLPAENYAIKMGVHPAKSTAENVANIKKQINDIAALYDWDMEVNTTDPEFYKWTQWIFVKMFKEGLAYEKEFPINWCPSCKTGLANEEVVNGVCERCGTTVTKKNLRQWMLKITAYAERLLSDLDKLYWPEKVRTRREDHRLHHPPRHPLRRHLHGTGPRARNRKGSGHRGDAAGRRRLHLPFLHALQRRSRPGQRKNRRIYRKLCHQSHEWR